MYTKCICKWSRGCFSSPKNHQNSKLITLFFNVFRNYFNCNSWNANYNNFDTISDFKINENNYICYEHWKNKSVSSFQLIKCIDYEQSKNTFQPFPILNADSNVNSYLLKWDEINDNISITILPTRAIINYLKDNLNLDNIDDIIKFLIDNVNDNFHIVNENMNLKNTGLKFSFRDNNSINMYMDKWLAVQLSELIINMIK